MNWNQFAQDVHLVAVANGLWDKPPSFAEFIVDCRADLSKAAEAYRDGKPTVYYPCSYDGHPCVAECPDYVTDPEIQDGECLSRSKCPHGVAAHLADCILRILDYLAAEEREGEEGVLDECVEAVAPRGSFIEMVNDLHLFLCEAYKAECDKKRYDTLGYLELCVGIIRGWGDGNNVDMESILQAKHTYNKSRVRPAGGDKPQEVTD